MAGSLASAGVTAGGAGTPAGARGNAAATAATLGAGTQVVLGSAGGNPADALAGIITGSGAPLPAGKTAAEVAAAAIQSGLVTVTSAGELATSTNTGSGTQTDTLTAGGSVDAAAGIAKWWAVFLIKHSNPENPLVRVDDPYGCPGCPRPPGIPTGPSTPTTPVPGR